MASGLEGRPGIGLITGYNPEEVAHTTMVPTQQLLPTDKDLGATSGDKGEDAPGNSWVEVLYKRKEHKRDMQAPDIQAQVKTNATSAIRQKTKAFGYKVLDARRLGKSHSAVIVFAGNKVPFTVSFNWLETPCFIYKKTKAACLNCGEVGHRADVCSKPAGFACTLCGTASVGESHVCTPKCALCGGAHRTYDRTCPEKFYKRTQTDKAKRQSRGEQRTGEAQVRWLSKETERSESRARARSRSRSASCQRKPSQTTTTSQTKRKRGKKTKGDATRGEIRTDTDDHGKWPAIPTAGGQGDKTKVQGGADKHVQELKRELAQYKKSIEEMRRENERMRNANAEDQYVATLVHKLYSATKREFESQGASSCHLTVIPVKTGDQGVHVVNIYCNPKDHKTDIRRVVSTAPHPARGYRFVTPKGRRLAEVINRERLTLLTDSDQPTRTGSSTTRDTCPDLTIVKNVESAEWRNLQGQLGSDHCILETIIHRRGFKRKLGKTKITDWDKWRKQRSGIPPTIENIEEWTKTISDSIKSFSTEVERTDKDPDVDKHLLHLWKARRALTKRWKRQRHNKVLRKKIAELTAKAEENAIKLASQNWYGVCDRIRGNLGSAQSWRLLRALIDPGKTKTATTNRLAELVFKIAEPQDRILDQLATRYLCLDPPVVQRDYEGRENPDLDRPITAGMDSQVPEGEEEIDYDTRQKFKISKLPKNMHPERDEGRRRARTAAIAHSWDNREGALYVDAAGPSLGVAAIAVASAQGKILRVASIRVDSAEQAEEAAIALAVSCNPRATVITDSQKACRNYARGVLGRPALRILKKVQVQAMRVHLIWAPGHMGHTGNEAANAAARAALYRDSSPCPVEPAPDMPYNKYLATLRQVRKEFPAPHKILSKKEEFIWRRLQTDTVTTPTKLHTWYPERFHSASCLFCGAPWADVHHLAWVCKKIPGLTPLEEPKKEEWEAGLRSEEADKQKLLVGRAGVVIDAIGALD
ncbi:hypothetical protein HPB47_016908 [Ixodes persulcatus]|uniref:Uncharacterized protein n=1 Tax=Ixodes persulcatus TaxID=34615 RepID=A0AC60QTD2_IXOPE|nr:hypothetical protein HPB47_016908 [Ixodes persulcatus]